MKKSRLILFVCFFIFMIMLFAWFALQQIKNVSLTNIKNSLQTVVQTTHEGLQLWIHHRQDDLLSITHDSQIIALSTALVNEYNQNPQSLIQSKTLQHLRKIIVTKMRIHRDLGFFIIAPDKINIAAVNDKDINNENRIFAMRPEYTRRILAGETLFIPPVLFEKSNSYLCEKNSMCNHSIFIATPLFDQQRNFLAILALQIDPSLGFTRVTQLGRIGATGETYAFDKEGLLITNSRFDEQLKEIGLISPHEQSMLSVRITDPGVNLLKHQNVLINNRQLPLTEMAKSAIAGQSGYNIEGYRDYRGVLVFGAWLWDKALDIGIATEIDVEEALTPYYKTRTLIILVVFIIAFLAFAGIYMWLLLDKKAKHSLEQVLKELEDKVDERTQELQALSYQDGLTGVANRRMFDQCIDKEWRRGQRTHQPLALLMIDIDSFKAYNDSYGHQQGDSCLKNVATILASEAKRATDLLARYGGEEFALLLPDTSLEQAIMIAEQCREKVQDTQILHQYSDVEGVHVATVSIGVSVIIPSLGLSSNMLVEAADKCLYIAKRNGRNRVEPNE